MKSIKKMLMGIAIILFGISLVASNTGGVFIYVGWGISIVGLIMRFVGHYFTEDDKQ